VNFLEQNYRLNTTFKSYGSLSEPDDDSDLSRSGSATSCGRFTQELSRFCRIKKLRFLTNVQKIKTLKSRFYTKKIKKRKNIFLHL